MERPKVGVGVAVVRDGMVLLQRRKGKHGQGTWCFPGGHLEYGESIEDCARRETLEESGVRIANPRVATVTNDLFEDGSHYVTVFVVAEWNSGEAKLLEPEKAEEWGWFRWESLPEPRFLPLENLIKQGFRPEKAV